MLDEETRRNLFHISAEKEEQIEMMINAENERDHNQREYKQVALPSECTTLDI